MATPKECQYCHAELSRDEIGLSKKLFESETKKGKYSCMPCIAAMLEVTQDDLIAKIEEFKRQGCKLFS